MCRIEPFHDLATAKKSLPTDDQWAINEMFSDDQEEKVAKAIQCGDATGISDGSYKNKRGTAACIIEANKDTSSRIYAFHDTPGLPSFDLLTDIRTKLKQLPITVNFFG